MKLEEIGLRSRLGMRGLKNRALIEVSEDPKTGQFVLVMGKGIRRKWLLCNLPEGMWKASGAKEEVIATIDDFLKNKVLSI